MSTAIAALLNLAPEAAFQLASAKRAQKAELEGAKAWRSLVRIKLLGQLTGLAVSSTLNNALVGASCIVFADVAFWALGAGTKRFECCDETESDGNSIIVRSAPIPVSVAKVLLSFNIVMLLSTLSGCIFGQSRTLLRRVCSGIFCFGILTQTIGVEDHFSWS